jgi:LmbE family N-acetylglucosaminyl deacetylase
MNVLAVGAHPDDIELGCGAALLAHRRAGHAVTLLVMTDGRQGPQERRSRRAEQEEAASMLEARVIWGEFADGEIPDGGPAIRVIEEATEICGADVVYTHSISDSHQDHRATAQASLSACRRAKRILCYETPTSLTFAPTVFIDADGLVEGKLQLLRAHLSQVLKNGLVDLEAVEAQARYRGFQARLRHAEAFEASRFVWDVASTTTDSEVSRLTTKETSI